MNLRPDIFAAVQIISPGGDAVNKDEFMAMRKTTKFLKATSNVRWTFVPIDLNSSRRVLFSYASFAYSRGLRSQLGYVIALCEDAGTWNIIYYGSNRCKRIVRSVMAAKAHGLVLGFDFSVVVQHLLSELLGRKVSLEAFVDRKTLFNVILKDG